MLKGKICERDKLDESTETKLGSIYFDMSMETGPCKLYKGNKAKKHPSFGGRFFRDMGQKRH